MISKRRLLNGLFLLGFPMYGFGLYRAFKGNLSEGLVLGMVPFLLIIGIHLVDLLYRPVVRIMMNRVYWVGLAYLLSLCAAQWYSYFTAFPGYNTINTTVYCLLFLVPFHASLIVQLHNRDSDRFNFSRLILFGLLLLVALNLIGYAAGHRNEVHGFEGRMNLPYMHGVYDAAHILSFINLMLLFYLRDPLKRPLRFFAVLLIYAVNLVIMINVNSRLSLMAFLVLTVLFVLKLFKGFRFVFLISLFTMPLLISGAHLVYKIITLPVFAEVVERVDKEDVTTFNSRTYIWEEAWNWLVDDRRGFFFGNGHNGQYVLGMMDQIAVIWETDQPYDIPMHSTFLAIVMSQGFVGYVLYCLAMWYAYTRFRRHYLNDGPEAPLFAGVVYLLFIWQIDMFCYGLDLGNPLFFCILAYVAVARKFISRRSYEALGTVRSPGMTS